MIKYKINSPELLKLSEVENFWKNINFTFDSSLKEYYVTKFPWYYIFKVHKDIVEEVYYNIFFKSTRYKKALDDKLLSNKRESYILTRKVWDYYILDAHDYVWEIIKYFANSDNEFSIQYYGNIFWLYHDLWHVFLNHLYTTDSYKHKDEMDASIFAIIKLLYLNKFDEVEFKREVLNATKKCLKTGDIINLDDIQYLFTFKDYFKKLI